ncbi:MAG: SAM-dependent methyltransferase [Janthinobacterium lividum]
MNTPDTSAAFFEGMFRTSADPWNFAADDYEQARYDVILRALAGRRYRHAFEPGCSVGALTAKLATLCDQVDATDFSPSAAEQARLRCQSLPGVTVRCAAFTSREPVEGFDLVVLSELGYYFSAAQWQDVLQHVVDGMQPGAILLASHWLGKSPDHLLSGDEVHDLMQHAHLYHEHGERNPDATRGGFRLDRWSKRS